MKTALTLLILLTTNALFAQEVTESWSSNQTGVYSYSSPRAIDLTGDGIKDIVLGAGRENQESSKGIIAVNGSNGETLWTVPTRNQIYASPIFQDITNDGVADIFIGGREAEFYAVNGANGNIIWEFFPQADTVNPVDSGWYNFYSPQWLPDQNGDGIQDLLLANGGDYNATILNEDRPQGNIMVVSGLNGSVLAIAGVPDEKETYMSPLVADLYNSGTLQIIFGTGGENDFNSGHIYKAPLSDLMNNDLSNAQIVLASPEKGFIAPPSLADLNDDSVLDIIVNAYDGKVVAVSGLDNSVLWEAQIQGGETNASPGIGHFNDDNIPDIFSTYAIGLAPTFTDFRQVMIDGETGEILFNESIGFFQFNSPTVADLDQDGFDEVIMTTNEINTQTFDAMHDVRIFDFNDGTNEIVYGPLQGANVNSTALLSNIDNNGQLDFIYIHSQEASIGNTEAGFFLKKLELDTPDNIDIAWGGYIGTNYDGSYENPKEPCNEADYFVTVETTAVGCGTLGSATVTTDLCASGNCETIWLNENFVVAATSSTAENLEAGTYYIKIINLDECEYNQQVIIETSESDIELLVTANIASACNASDGSVFIEFESGTPPYITNFNGAESSPTNVSVYLQNNLAPGTYNFSVSDAQGCTSSQEIIIEPLPIEVTYTEQCDAGICAYQINVSGGSGNYTATINGETITNNNFLINENGSYELIVEDGSGCLYQETITVEITSIETITENNISFKQFPNQIIIESETPIQSWELININGQVINNDSQLATKHQINTQNLANGVYLLKFEINNEKIIEKFYKK